MNSLTQKISEMLKLICRRSYARCFTIVMMFVAMNAECLAQQSDFRRQDKPNVLFISIDDLGCTLGCYGDLVAKTPNIDRLAAKGVCFERAYNQLPLCNPARASLMTGLRPDTIKVYDLDRHFRDEVPDVVTLPQAFQQAGYFTARVGKIYHYDVPNAIGTDGFDDPPSWNRTVNPKGRDKADESLVFNAEPHRPISGSLSWLAAEGTDDEQTDGMIATAAIEILRERRDKPFFLGVGFFRPHTPYVAPKRYFDLYPTTQLRLPYAPNGDRDDVPVSAFAHNCPVSNYGLDYTTLLKATQAYYACVSFVDTQVGRLVACLDELGIGDNTIVVLWSDHGYHLGEHHGVWQKRTLFEQGARTPLVIASPHTLGRGPTRQIVELVDLYPTLTDLAGIESPQCLEGRSLRSLLDDPVAPWDGFAVTQVLRPADARLSEPVMGCSIRTPRYRYTEWAEGREGVELYDHQSDPGEFHNLAQDRTADVNETIEELSSRLRSRASGKVPSTPFNPSRL
jgi:iduronate 2-sulfatase